jgi:hypothetical protein
VTDLAVTTVLGVAGEEATDPTKVPVPVGTTTPGLYENIEAGIVGPPLTGVSALMRTDESQFVLDPRVSVTAT